MAEAAKSLFQSIPLAATLTDALTVGAGKSVVLSSIFICNRGSDDARFRIAVAVAGAADTVVQYIYYDELVLGNKTYKVTAGITLSETDVLRVYASNVNLSFNGFGVEIS